MPTHLLHPAAVHFPLALLTLGLFVAALAASRRGPAWSAEAAAWLLWLGTASAWAALGLGVVAEKTAAHVPSAWEALEDHETLAWWTAAVFTALSGWRYWAKRTSREAGALFAALWAVAACLLLRTAWLGGELVFRHGVGALPEEAVEEPLH